MTKTQFKQNIKGVLRTCCSVCAPAFRKKAKISASQARVLLEQCAPKPAGTCKAANLLTEVTCDLQIVVPAYNVEAYLDECMDSILSQKTGYTFHVILVDDGAKDRTPELCDRYQDDPRVTVIHQKNRGLSGARNTGIRELFGRYVLFVDSDDCMTEGAVEGLLRTAYSMDADLVEGGAYYLTESGRTVMHRYDRDREIADACSELHGHAWGKLYKRELLENCCFPEGYWYEDTVLSFLIFGLAKKICVSSQMAYAYRINQEGIVRSSKGKPRAVETYWITEQMLQERKEAGLPMDAAFFRFMLLQIRLNQLRLSDLEEAVQESAFVLTCELLDSCFPPEFRMGKEKNLIKALETGDFGMFKMCCKFF